MEKWENRSGSRHKGIFFICGDVHGSRLLWPARSRQDRGGLKQEGLGLGSAGLLATAERDRRAGSSLLLAMACLFPSLSARLFGSRADGGMRASGCS